MVGKHSSGTESPQDVTTASSPARGGSRFRRFWGAPKALELGFQELERTFKEPREWKKGNLKFALEQVQRVLDRQWTSRDALVGRAGILIGVGAAAIGVLLGDTTRVPGAYLPLFYLSIGALLASILAGFSAYVVKDAEYPPKPAVLIGMLGEEENEIQVKILKSLRNAVSRNDLTLQVMKDRINATIVLLVASLMLEGWLIAR